MPPPQIEGFRAPLAFRAAIQKYFGIIIRTREESERERHFSSALAAGGGNGCGGGAAMVSTLATRGTVCILCGKSRFREKEHDPPSASHPHHGNALLSSSSLAPPQNHPILSFSYSPTGLRIVTVDTRAFYAYLEKEEKGVKQDGSNNSCSGGGGKGESPMALSSALLSSLAFYVYLREEAPPCPSTYASTSSLSTRMTAGGGGGGVLFKGGPYIPHASSASTPQRGLCAACSLILPQPPQSSSSSSHTATAAPCGQQPPLSNMPPPSSSSALSSLSSPSLPTAHASLLYGRFIPDNCILSRRVVANSPFLRLVLERILTAPDLEWLVRHGAVVCQRDAGEGFQHVLGTCLSEDLPREVKVYRRPLTSFATVRGRRIVGGLGERNAPRRVSKRAIRSNSLGKKRLRDDGGGSPAANDGRNVRGGGRRVEMRLHNNATSSKLVSQPSKKVAKKPANISVVAIMTASEKARACCLKKAFSVPLPTVGLLDLEGLRGLLKRAAIEKKLRNASRTERTSGGADNALEADVADEGNTIVGTDGVTRANFEEKRGTGVSFLEQLAKLVARPRGGGGRMGRIGGGNGNKEGREWENTAGQGFAIDAEGKQQGTAGLDYLASKLNAFRKEFADANTCVDILSRQSLPTTLEVWPSSIAIASAEGGSSPMRGLGCRSPRPLFGVRFGLRTPPQIPGVQKTGPRTPQGKMRQKGAKKRRKNEFSDLMPVENRQSRSPRPGVRSPNWTTGSRSPDSDIPVRGGGDDVQTSLAHTLDILFCQLSALDLRKHVLKFTSDLEAMFFNRKEGSIVGEPSVADATVSNAIVADYLMSILGSLKYVPPPSPPVVPTAVVDNTAPCVQFPTSGGMSDSVVKAASPRTSLLPLPPPLPLPHTALLPTPSISASPFAGLLPLPSTAIGGDIFSSSCLPSFCLPSLLPPPPPLQNAMSTLKGRLAGDGLSLFAPPPLSAGPRAVNGEIGFQTPPQLDHALSVHSATLPQTATSTTIASPQQQYQHHQQYKCFWGGPSNVEALRTSLCRWLGGGITKSPALPLLGGGGGNGGGVGSTVACLLSSHFLTSLAPSSVPWAVGVRARQRRRKSQLQQCLVAELLAFAVRHIVPLLLAPCFYFTHTPRNRSAFVIIPTRIWHLLRANALTRLYGLRSVVKTTRIRTTTAINTARRTTVTAESAEICGENDNVNHDENAAVNRKGKDSERTVPFPHQLQPQPTPQPQPQPPSRHIGLKTIKPLDIWRKSQRLERILPLPPPPSRSARSFPIFPNPSSLSSSSTASFSFFQSRRTCLYSLIRLLPDGNKLRPIATLKASTPNRLVFATRMRRGKRRSADAQPIGADAAEPLPPPPPLQPAAATSTEPLPPRVTHHSNHNANLNVKAVRPNNGILLQARLALAAGHQQRCERLGLPPFISNRGHDEEYSEWLDLHRNCSDAFYHHHASLQRHHHQHTAAAGAAGAAHQQGLAPNCVELKGHGHGINSAQRGIVDSFEDGNDADDDFGARYPFTQVDVHNRSTLLSSSQWDRQASGKGDDTEREGGGDGGGCVINGEDVSLSVSAPQAPCPLPFIYFVRGDAQKCYDSLPQDAIQQCILETIPHSYYCSVPMTAIVRQRKRGRSDVEQHNAGRDGDEAFSSSPPPSPPSCVRQWSCLVASDDFATGVVRGIPRGWVVEEAGAVPANNSSTSAIGYCVRRHNALPHSPSPSSFCNSSTLIGPLDVSAMTTPSSALRASSSSSSSSSSLSPYTYPSLDGAVLRRALEVHTRQHLIAIHDGSSSSGMTSHSPSSPPHESIALPSPFFAKVFKQSIGVPQGSCVSMPLCDALFLAVDQSLCGVLGEHTEGQHMLLRRVDDVMVATTSAACAVGAVGRLREGWPSVGFYCAPEKTLCTAMLTASSSIASSSSVFEPVPWCGLLVRSLPSPLQQSQCHHGDEDNDHDDRPVFFFAFSIDWRRYFSASSSARPKTTPSRCRHGISNTTTTVSMARPGATDTLLSSLRLANVIRMRSPLTLFCPTINPFSRRLQTVAEMAMVWCDAFVARLVVNGSFVRPNARCLLLKPFAIAKRFFTQHVCRRQQARVIAMARGRAKTGGGAAAAAAHDHRNKRQTTNEGRLLSQQDVGWAMGKGICWALHRHLLPQMCRRQRNNVHHRHARQKEGIALGIKKTDERRNNAAANNSLPKDIDNNSNTERKDSSFPFKDPFVRTLLAIGARKEAEGERFLKPFTSSTRTATRAGKSARQVNAKATAEEFKTSSSSSSTPATVHTAALSSSKPTHDAEARATHKSSHCEAKRNSSGAAAARAQVYDDAFREAILTVAPLMV